jgi:NHLM bacteriocin system ABC transporter ATP-binding protein
VPPPGAGEVVALDASTPLRLDAGAVGWLVERGRVHLFAVSLRDNAPSGIRHPLCDIKTGCLIAALPACADQTIIAVGQLDTTIRPLTDGDDCWLAERRAKLIEQWLTTLGTSIYGPLPAWPEHLAVADETVELPADKDLHAPDAPVWLLVRRGRLLIGGRPVEVGESAPIVAGLCARAVEGCTVEPSATIGAVARQLDTPGLERFHAILLDAAGQRIAAAEAAALQRMAARRSADRRSSEGALHRLAGVQRAAAPAPQAASGSDPLAAAFAMVAAHAGIDLSQAPRPEAGARAPLRALARANGVGLRTVLLRGDWWRSENGPLLAWRGPDKQPVALTPSRRGAYQLWDPETGGSSPVDQASALEINAQATAIYRPLPSAIRGLAGLLRFASRGIRGDATMIATMAGLAAFLAMLLPIATGFLLESVAPRAELGQMLAVVGGLALAVLGAGVFDLVKALALLRLEARLESALQPALLLRLLALPVNFFRGFGTGELTNRVLSIRAMRQILASNSLLAVLSGVFALSSLAVIILYSPFLAGLSAGLVLIAAIIVGALAIGELRQERARTALRGQEDNLVIQVIQGIVKLRVAAGENRVFAQWAALFGRQKQYYRRGQYYAGVAEGITEIYPIFALLLLYFAASRLLGGSETAGRSLELGGFLAINAAFGQLLAATMTLARTMATTLEIVPLFERLRPVIAAEPEARQGKEAPDLSGRIELRHVSFRYGEGSPLVLDDVSLGIEPGAFVAVVGPSGSGKSTLLRLLLGFETPDRGDILYDGQSIGALDPASLRRQIGVVLQHARVTTGSIFENITSDLPYTIDDAWAAARLAGFDAEIEAMPMGMHTLLLEGSITLSGGQRQRLVLARALIGRPRIIIFDEATSALDNRTQAVVTESLASLRMTRIVIAHRLSTIARADRIFVLDHGRFAESGSFDELIAADGLFSRLARRQIL